MSTMPRGCALLLLLACVLGVCAGAPVEPAAETHPEWPEGWQENPAGFWFGVQNLHCLKSKVRRRRAAGGSTMEHLEALERSTIQYVHRLLYYRGQVYEWGAGTKGFHYGASPAMAHCGVTWEAAPAGESRCEAPALEEYTDGYRARYGGYNMVTNNCHHYANRLGALLLADTCTIGDDKWVRFNEKFWGFVKRFMAIFDPGSMEHDHSVGPAAGNPHNVQDWPIVQWYRRR